MLKALHGWYQWKAEIESNLEVPSIQSTFWVMWRKFNIKLSHSVFTWPLFVRKCLFFQTNQPFTQTCDICTHIVSYMVGKLLKRSTFLRTQLHSYDANLKSYEFIPHAGISNMWDLTPHPSDKKQNTIHRYQVSDAVHCDLHNALCTVPSPNPPSTSTTLHH